MRRKLMILLLLNIAGCIDMNLSDEVNWPDGWTPDADIDSGDDTGPPGHDGNVIADAGPGHDTTVDGAHPDTTPPWLVPAVGCGGSEVLLGSICVSAGPRGIALRLWASEPVTASAQSVSDEELTSVDTAALNHHLVLAPLSPDFDLEIVVEITDQASLSVSEGPLAIRTSSLTSTVVINEVLFDPLGPEPQQEFIELYNTGADEVSLEGWTIADEGGTDLLAPPAPLLPEGYALIISEGYEPGAGGDPPPRAGALMIQLDGSIGSAGLRNSGEEITVLDSTGNVVSMVPAPASSPGAGTSIERVNPLAPDGDPANWTPNAAESATPGGPNSVTSD